MQNIWFDDWQSIVHIIYVTPVAYVMMVILLRVSGKRTLSKMNAFDFVVTIALGTILATIALNKDVPLANGIAAFLVFIGCQFLFTWLAVRLKSVKTLITSTPTLIFYQGSFQHWAMKKERITVEEVHSAARQKGYSNLTDVDMIILETTGDIAIIKKIISLEQTTFDDVNVEV